jgi:transposase
MEERAVRLVFEVTDLGNVSTACRRVGEQLRINPDTVRGWVKQAEIDVGAPGGHHQRGHGTASAAGEGERRAAANAILRTASAFFATELDRPSAR